ncbi:MAG: hypothetical protein GEU94_06325 [Micromonosporaceae bacterium]|nr:hypothetical protein [Micromonosporaceae bacterium]
MNDLPTVIDSVVHPVPYYSQWESADLVADIVTGATRAADDPRWAHSGATTSEEYEWWAGRLCGVACLRMVLDHWRGVAPPSVRLAQECLDAGAYVKRDGGLDGLLYAPFAEYARHRWGLAAECRPDLPATEIPRQIADGRLVMLSVHRSIRTLDPAPPRRGGHLVLAVGATPDAVVIHNPSGLPGRSQRHARVPWSDLDLFYAQRGVVLGQTGEAS